ncbi:unnamed protein product [Camellia sinensis]
MSLIGRERCDDDFSVIGDKGEIGFLDFEDDKSLRAYDPNEEGPVLISIPFPFIRGKPLSVFVGETSAHPITIQNTTSEPVELWGVNFFCSNPADSFTLSLLKPPSVNSDADYIQDFLEGFSLEDRVLQPLQTQTIWLSCKPKDIGLHTSVVHFDVGDERIERVVFVLAEDKISRSLASKKPYSRFPRRKQFATNESAKTKTRGLDYKLPLFEIPMGVRELVENKQVPEVITQGLMKENYATYFNTLLNMEELHLEKEMRCHDMERITMRRKGANLLALAVPGLAERRPSLVHGDFAFAMLAFQGENDTSPPYQCTGKTMTLVEAILQLYATRKDAHVLVCAASNSAADHILEKPVNNEAVGVKENEIFRLNATSRSYEDVQANNIRFCFFEDFIFKCPPLMALMHYRVIISTYMSSSLLYVEGICCGHFSHVFLDEAGQASEPEAMVPISNLCESETVVVLAGDPMQLGPVVYSKDAKVFGLRKSYLERHFECEYYHNRDESFITKLVRNYRCHPAILHVPSKLFYRQKLLACKEDTSSLKCWLSLLPNKEFPVLFIGIQGCDEREGNDPSWFNRIEASKVVDIVKKLRGSEGLREEDIGVIAPYRQQVVKITKVLESFDMGSVKVGSVEQFQGQEREVIIVSTVRSTAKHNGFDKTYCLGFLSNPRRFNVAVTRAKSLLIIVGNPHIVSKECCRSGAHQGTQTSNNTQDLTWFGKSPTSTGNGFTILNKMR